MVEILFSLGIVNRTEYHRWTADMGGDEETGFGDEGKQLWDRCQEL